jgi:hypothetical protein
MRETHATRPRRFHILLLICLVLVPAAVTAAASLSAQGTTSPSDLYLPVILTGGVPASTSGTLQDGDILAGPDGLLLGAVGGTLISPVQLTVTRIGAPATPLDPDVTPLSDFYNLQADRDLYTPADHPLLIGLPVPDGVDTTHLAMAVLVPPDHIPFSDDGLPHWFLFRGNYDVPNELLVAAIGGLSSSGYQLALVDAPNQTPLVPASASQLSPQTHLVSFEVLCSSHYSGTQCGDAQTDKVAVELSNAYDDFQDLLGFRNPLLHDRYGGLNPLALFGYHSYYNIFLAPPPGSTCFVEGEYTALSNLKICVPGGSSITAYDVETIRHEYFHATQYGYDTIRNQPTNQWVTDGTATAAQRSVLTMTRSLHYDLRMIDVPLADSSAAHRYAAQDFFVFLGQKQNAGLDYLIPLFEVGATTADVVEVFGENGHLPLYWDWVKNQALEKTVDFDELLQDPCALQGNVVTQIHPWAFDHTVSLTHTVGTLQPLTSVLVGVYWDGSYDIADGSVYPSTGFGDTEATDALRYKFYRDGEDGCAGVPDGRRLFLKEDGEISPANNYWVLISNIHPSNSFAYTIRFEVSPIPPN